jgi:hypothetical protein
VGTIVFDVVIAPGCAPTTEVPEFVMAGAGEAVVGASCAGTCWRFEIDGVVTAGKLLAGVVGIADEGT